MKKFDLQNDPKIGSGFKTPDNYFDRLETQIMEQLPQPKARVIPLWQRSSVWMSSIAATFLLVAGLSIYYNGQRNSVKSLDDTTVETYLQANVNSYDIIQHLDESDIKALEKTIVLNNDAVEAYLSDHNNLDLYLNE
ncbi:hypothetical protein [Flavobacterium cerinum]|uniref:Anti-sigma factor n=1 Tax=Flavobacterium cerinum TaxID=2502784 RepID=A0ABY5IMH8_9FLAO|nr:hypothetical protein [Flavobacterium cerinum]UUC43829.1 hypothetical protein NOX80_09305 [Flavobacterium cerinum]